MIAATRALARDYPDVPVIPVCDDYTQTFELPRRIGGTRRLGFFPGSTIGNFAPTEACAFLTNAAATIGPGGGLVIGVHLKKDERVLRAAYNDDSGITAAFNFNILRRINRELGADFDLDAFAHHAPYNAERGRIEMHLVSLKDQVVRLAGRCFTRTSQCAPTARNTSGGRIHPDSCRFDLVADRRSCRVTGGTEAL